MINLVYCLFGVGKLEIISQKKLENCYLNFRNVFTKFLGFFELKNHNSTFLTVLYLYIAYQVVWSKDYKGKNIEIDKDYPNVCHIEGNKFKQSIRATEPLSKTQNTIWYVQYKGYQGGGSFTGS